MDYTRLTTHTFDMNEYFSGQRFSIGGRDYEKEDREEIMAKLAPQEKSENVTLSGRDIKEILRSIYRQ